MSRKWLMLAVAFFSVFSFLFAMQSLPPVIPQIMEEFNVSHAETSLLMSLVALPVIFLSLPAGVLTVKRGPKRVSGPGFALATFGVLITYLANSFLWLEIGRLMLGIGGALVAVSAISIIPQWFSREELGKAMGIYAINMPLVTIAALNLLPRIASEFGWRSSFLIATIILAAAALANISLIQGRSSTKESKPMLRGIKNEQIWFVGLIWALYNIAALSYTTWAGTFFIEMKGISSGVAFFLASFLMIATMVLAPIVGRVSDKFGKRRIFLMIASLGMGISLLFIPGVSLPLLILPVVSLGVTAAFLSPVLFSLPSEILSPKMAGLGFGVLNTFLGVAVTAGPSLIGYIRDTFSGEPPVYITMAIFSFLAFVCASLLKTR